jgi:hypothetical protein
MKPALLIIIMDFLVSSLLLFISGPGLPAEVRRPARRLPLVEVAPEFAPAALLAMEEQWAQEYQQQAAAARLSAQADQLSALSGHAQTLAEQKAQLATRVATQERQLAESQNAMTALHNERTRQEESWRTELARQAETLRQTQETRATLLTERDAVTAQKADVARRLQETLEQKNVLAGQAQQLRTRLDHQEATIQKQNETLASQQAALQRELHELAKAQRDVGQTTEEIRRDQRAMWSELSADTMALGSGLSTIQTQQLAMAGGLSQVDAKLARTEARQVGPFARFRDARVALDITLRAQRAGTDSAARSAKPYAAQATLHAPLFAAAGGTWLAVQAEELSLAWPTDYRVTAVHLRLRPPGTNTPVRAVPGPLMVAAGEGSVAFVRLPDGTALPGITPTPLLGRAALDKRGVRDIYLFKHSAEGLGAPVEVALDLNRPGFLVIRKTYRGWINFLARNLTVSAAARPEAGDCLVTAEGDVLGLMLDDSHGCILSESDLTTPGRVIPLADPAAFMREAAAWQAQR